MGITYNTGIVRSGLVLHLDAANVKSYPGSGTSWYDLSGNGNNGTLVNSPTYSTLNKGGIIFDGVDDYVDFVSPTNTLFCNSNGGTTITYWVICTNFSGGSIFQDKNITATCWNGTFDTLFYNTAKKKLVTSLQTNTTYCITIDTTNFLFYVNGNLAQTTDVTYGWTVDNLPPRIGKNWYSPLVGTIYNFTVYNRILSATEVKQNFEALRGRYGL